jgi:hypothetical protein
MDGWMEACLGWMISVAYGKDSVQVLRFEDILMYSHLEPVSSHLLSTCAKK